MGFDDVPVNRFFDYRLVSRSSEEAVISMEVRPEFLQEEGLVQGGVLSALADTAAVYVFYPDLRDDETMTSIEFKVNFLKPGTAARGSLVARARPIRRGRRIAVCDVEVLQSDELILKGLFTYMFYPRTGRALE